MSYTAEVHNVMLASPSDVGEERSLAREIILDWNNVNSPTRRIILLPVTWEFNSIPAAGRPQEVINKQVLRNADILVGIFWTRIGTPTGKAASGTVEEIEEHINSGKPAMLYFSNKPVIPDSIDLDQYNSVKRLKKEYQSQNLTSDFESLEDFRIKFQRHLALKLNEEQYQGRAISVSTEYPFSAFVEPSLSTNANALLIEASKSASGQISKIGFKGGFSIRSNGKQFNEGGDPRSSAMWEAVLQELLDNDLVSDNGYKGEIFSVTKAGYDHADKIKDQS